MNRVAVWLVAALCFLSLPASIPNPYPNEIEHLKFYDLYLGHLRPGRSDANEVRQVFGSDQRLELDGWRVGVLYSCDGDPIACSHGPRNDHVYQIVVSPKRRVSLAGQQFPNVFSHSYGSVSEINVTCDVYKDSSGLEYWIISKDFPSYKKGDLLQVVYGVAQSDSTKSASAISD